jgi:IclR family transcriptional regulator, acetate operon repressor
VATLTARQPEGADDDDREAVMREPGTREPGGVQSVERVIDLLELLADAPGEVPLGRLAGASGLPPSTVHRLMTTLVGRGYARRLPSRAYVLGPRLIHLGERSASTLGLLARPHLVRLVDEIGETANLALLDGDRVVYAAQVPSRHSMRMFTEVGRRVRLHCTGVGKVLLACRPADEARALLAGAGLPARTGRTITDVDVLMAQLPRIAAQGWAVDDGEQEAGVRCLAVPVPAGAVEAALSVSGPEGRLPLDALPRLVPVLRAAAAGLAAELSGTDPAADGDGAPPRGRSAVVRSDGGGVSSPARRPG